MKKAVIIIVLTFFSFSTFSQGVENKKLPLSPTAASLGRFDQVDMNHFNGLPVISVPLYTLKSRDLNLPLGLMYHASGVRPDIRGGWTGLNWSLSCPYSINRIMNGDPDEVVIAPGWAGMTYPDGQSYLINHGVLDRSDWNNPSTVNTYLNNYFIGTGADLEHRPIPAPDEFRFNFLGYTGSFFMDHEGEWVFKCDNPGSMKLKSVDIGEFFLSPLPPNESNTPLYKKRMFKSFVLVDASGTQYFFGGDENTIEFSRNKVPDDIFDDYGNLTIANSWFLTKILTVHGDEILFEYEKSSTYQVNNSVSWDNVAFNSAMFTYSQSGPGYNISKNLVNATYLKKIISATTVIDFDISVSNELVIPETYDGFFGHKDFPNTGLGGIEEPQYYKLDAIRVSERYGPEVKKIEFIYDEHPSRKMMLTDVLIKDVHNEKEQFSFTYYKDITKPLPGYLSRELDHWGFWNGRNWFAEQLPATSYASNSTTVSSYASSRDANFTYAVLGSLEKVTYPTGGHTKFIYELNDYNGLMNYYNSNYSSTYNPTSGITYEDLSGYPRTAGGLRVKEIQQYDHLTQTTDSRFFDYKKNATQSSGVLHGLPKYSESGTFSFSSGPANYFRWFNYSLQPYGETAGSFITYSQVKETLPDGSYIIRKYSNQDDVNCRDQSGDAMVANTLFGAGIPYNSMANERGLLLEEQFYNDDDEMVQKSLYEYNKDPNRFQKYVRIVDFKIVPLDEVNNVSPLFDGTDIPMTLPFYMMQAYAYKKYIYPQLLTKKETYTYSATDAVKEVSNYVYDDKNNVKESWTEDSKGKIIKTYYKYPGDYNTVTTTDDASKGIALLKSKDVTGIPVEKITVRADGNGANPFVSTAELTDFDKDVPAVKRTYLLKDPGVLAYTPGIFDSYIDISGNLIFNSGYEQMSEAVKYDNYGNIFEQRGRPGIYTSFAWTPDRSLVVAKVTQAHWNDIGWAGFENQGDDYFNEGRYASGGIHTADAFTGRSCYAVEQGSSAAGVGHVFTPTQQNKYIFSAWVKTPAGYSTGQMVVHTALPSSPTVRYPVNAESEKTISIPSTSGQWQLIRLELDLAQAKQLSGIVTDIVVRARITNSDPVHDLLIDDIRFYPSGSHMETYTYDPVYGVTSMTNANDQPSFYEYDAFGRLWIIRDQDRNILKRICYNYVGQQENCNIYTYWNVEKSQSFLRDNCPPGSTAGAPYSYVVPANTYYSHISQADADQKALDDIALNGQAAANTSGECISLAVYAKVRMENIVSGTGGTHGDLIVRFYEDEACTIPKDYCANFTIKYDVYSSACGCTSNVTYQSSTQYCGANEEVLVYGAVLLQEINPMGDYEEYNWYVETDDPYLIFK